ncbi:MAG: hypothetical protein OXH78_08980 [Acidimicrobiaceae bacterium]|nr:hypothetical protein [Acidimicrobiaceae bacterium]
MPTRSKTLVIVALALASCSGSGSASECRDAALAQAQAEDSYLAALTAHEEQHSAGNDTHPDLDDQTLAARVHLIITTEATRRACQ